MFDNGILKSTAFQFPVICIGNLTVGGTGKSPTTNYLIDLLKPHFKTAVLSRGYGRKTKGFELATEKSTAEQIGDEPLMYFKRNNLFSASRSTSLLESGLGAEVQIAVCEDRVTGINTLINKFNDLQVVLLDDAYQHRAVNAGLNILITDYANLYSEDYLLPMGNLRESIAGASRAQLVIISKCPENLSDTEKKAITEKLRKSKNQQYFFSYMKYAALTNVLNPLAGPPTPEGGEWNSDFPSPFGGRAAESNSSKSPLGGWGGYAALLITGIAKPKPLVDYLQQHFKEIIHLDFKDHHNFTADDLSNARKKFDNIANHKKIIITTEKDWMRIQDGKLKIVFNDLPVYIQPITFEFNITEKQQFNNHILNYVRNNKTNS
jgi:tetraacyldisaccharide 4'-kinase